MHLKELKKKSPQDLLAYAEELEIENASNLRKQELMFACLKQLANNDVAIYGDFDRSAVDAESPELVVVARRSAR